ncbi:Hsp70 family protein [Aliivibrio sp. 1S128]|uniref:Hsp70 family protein n=1 Tax=Aliivibrio sp. 1S128 TaxID=1840085 RepID=UPI00080E8843|nr:Hsp70 family protein [Aliivibrio sp. 1S128]OCH12295.1 molecular chaperone DnaK [Aliivibrio sp. 1S128]
MSYSNRYLIGIDLGTTHTVVAYTDLSLGIETSPIEIFNIDQLIGPGEVARKPLLPSFRYHASQSQISDNDLTLPWNIKAIDGEIKNAIIGEWARELGSKVEGRQVVSAKSWLSHTKVDRTSDILPWAGAEDVEKVSPIVASASYLNHVRQSWNYHHPDAPMELQEVVVTVPASFDESARSFTIQAAKLAGLDKIILLEEPQAVCYDWYHHHQDTAKDILKNVPLMVVCDVGGGTTDLSLIQARFDKDELSLDRIGVGDHLMLGGDNIDLALAHLAEQRLDSSKKMTAAALTKLIQQTRKTKERLLSANAPDSGHITLLGSGSKLLGGSRKVELSKEEVHSIALDGFLPLTEFNDRPNQRQSAVVEFGLPYASDPAISKHLAQFLDNHKEVSMKALGWDQSDLADHHDRAIPIGLLLNGGVFNSPLLANRSVELLSHWKGDPVTQLSNPHPDLAVAYGAVAYGKARHGAQLKIGGGSARSFYLQLEEKNKQPQGLCLLAKGSDEGEEIRMTSRRFSLTLGEPVRFNLLSTTKDQLATSGMITELSDPSFVSLPPYVVTLESSKAKDELHANQKDRVEVTLACQFTEVGTIKIECVSIEDDSQRWLVEFEVRNQASNKSANLAEQISLPPRLPNAIVNIKEAYGGSKQNPNAIKAFSKNIEKLIGKRESWDLITSRELATALLDSKKRRRRSDKHEQNWLKMTGFALRPGFGYPADEWKISQAWETYQQGIQFESKQSWNDWWTFWRRISGGLNQEQQETILGDIAKYLHPGSLRNPKTLEDATNKSYEAMVRLSAALEHLDVEDKTLLSTWMLGHAKNGNQAQVHWWALGRICSRSPFYGSQHNLIPASQVSQWIPILLEQDWKEQPMAGFATVMMARLTGDRTLDVSDELREDIINKLKKSRSPQSWIDLVSNQQALTEADSKRLFGDALPAGLRLLN